MSKESRKEVRTYIAYWILAVSAAMFFAGLAQEIVPLPFLSMGASRAFIIISALVSLLIGAKLIGKEE